MISKKGKDESIMLYDKAGNASDLFAVWCNTYKQAISDDVIFCEDSSPYEIGVKPLTKKDLIPLAHDNKIINEFEEILRHNNVSDKENAFNRLIALFICKLVDEVTKSENAQLDFQWQSGKDDYELLQDRLQRLHRDGMKNFMGEEIFYVTNEYPEELFKTYTGTRRAEAIADLRRTIKKLKFYSNNDFAFKDVHNEELFLQNSKIVVEVVLLFQRYKIIYNETNQLLGDLFEKLLNKGFKQNEGQFFTPLPITRFIWDALPLKKMMEEGKLPTVIDYACGAGHFLIEAVEAINYFRQEKNTTWARDCIFGIEKDYRLARVAKISLFMHGAGDANIVFGEGLDSHPDKQIQDKKFSILVANPPYSVQGFKPHLKLKNQDAFQVLPKISDEGSEIECLFVERIAQALEGRGVAAVILPSSILSNNSNSYVAARENILQHFMIRAIVSLGNGTFSETGTNTVTLFLQKYGEMPKMTSLCEDCVSSIFASCGREAEFLNWKDREIYQAFLTVIGVSASDYERFLKEEYSYDELCDLDASLSYFKQYSQAYFASSAIKNMEKKKAFIGLDEEGQKKEKLKHFYREVKALEREKLVTFALLFGHKTLLVRSPESTEGQKEFLGYGWSKRKGDEGIKITKAGGLLYDEKNRSAEGTIAALVRAIFEKEEGGDSEVSDGLQEYAKVVESTSLIDFSLSSLVFAKSIRTVIKERQEIKSRWQMVRLGEVAEIKIGGTPSRNNPEYFRGNNLWVSISEMNGNVITNTKEKITDEAVKKSNVKLIKQGTTLVSFKLSIGKTAIAGADLYTNEAIAALIPISDNILNKYLFYLFNGKVINLDNTEYKSFGKSLNSTFLNNEVFIPLPPLDVQQKLVQECEAVDAEYETSRMKIEEYRAKIEVLFNKLEIVEKTGEGNCIKRLGDVCSLEYGKALREEDRINGKYPVMGSNGIVGYHNEYIVQAPCIIVGRKGSAGALTWSDSNCYPIDTTFYVKLKDDSVNLKFLFEIMKISSLNIEVKGSGVPGLNRNDAYNIPIPIPPLAVQQELVAKAESYETQIAYHKNILKESSAKKEEIVKRYL